MSSRWKPSTLSNTSREPAVTIGLRIQYTGTKALHYPRAISGTPEPVPKSLLQDIRQDLKALGLGSALPNNDNAHFSALMKHTVEIFWPHLQAHQAQSLKVHLWTRFEKLKTEMIASRSVSCIMFYILPGSVSSLHSHPPDEDLQGFVCDPSTTDKTFASSCRGAMALIRHAQEQDIKTTLTAPPKDPSPPSIAATHRNHSPRPGRAPSRPRVRRRSSSPPHSSAWRPPNRPPPTGPRADRVRSAPGPSSVDAPPSPPRKRSPEMDRDRIAEEEIRELKAKVRRLEDSRDAAQSRAREMRRQIDAARERAESVPPISAMEDELLTLKARAQRAETRERRLKTWLKGVLADEWTRAEPANMDEALALLDTKLATLRARAEQAETMNGRCEQADRRTNAVQLADGDAEIVPALLEALMQIARATTISAKIDSTSLDEGPTELS